MWTGVIVLCIAGTTQADLPDTACLRYNSPLFENLEQCERSLGKVLKSEQIRLMTSLPEYDLELDTAECQLSA